VHAAVTAPAAPLLLSASTRARPTRGVEQWKGSSEPRHGCPPRPLTLPDRVLRAEPIEARREGMARSHSLSCETLTRRWCHWSTSLLRTQWGSATLWVPTDDRSAS
jgi:hypothetical protein